MTCISSLARVRHTAFVLRCFSLRVSAPALHACRFELCGRTWIAIRSSLAPVAIVASLASVVLDFQSIILVACEEPGVAQSFVVVGLAELGIGGE